MSEKLFTYAGTRYPDYLKRGNAMQFVEPFARRFCVGKGVDVGCGEWPLAGAIPVELKHGLDAYKLPRECTELDYVFSSHCLEHLTDPFTALEHWRDRLKRPEQVVEPGVIFLYLPHPDMRYWRPEHCRKHRHLFHPEDVVAMLRALGFKDILCSERDLAWSFAVVGHRGQCDSDDTPR